MDKKNFIKDIILPLLGKQDFNKIENLCRDQLAESPNDIEILQYYAATADGQQLQLDNIHGLKSCNLWLETIYIKWESRLWEFVLVINVLLMRLERHVMKERGVVGEQSSVQLVGSKAGRVSSIEPTNTRGTPITPSRRQQ